MNKSVYSYKMEYSHDKQRARAIFKVGNYSRVILFDAKATETRRPSSIIAAALRRIAYAALSDADAIEKQFSAPTTRDDVEKQIAKMKIENTIF